MLISQPLFSYIKADNLIRKSQEVHIAKYIMISKSNKEAAENAKIGYLFKQLQKTLNSYEVPLVFVSVLSMN